MNPDHPALFDPASLRHGSAWNDVWSQVQVADPDVLKDPRRIRPFRPALEAAFGPLFRELADAYAVPVATRQALQKTPGNDDLVDRAMNLEFTLQESLEGLLTDALGAGLLTTVIATLVQGTDPSLGPGDEQDLWGRVPANVVGEQVLRATLADGRYYRLDHNVPQALEGLVHDPANAPFWDGWAREVNTRRHRLGGGLNDDHLASLLGDLMARTVRRMSLVPVTTTLFNRLDAIKGWSRRGWNHAGYTAAQALKGSFTRIRSPEHDALYALAPQGFWDGLRSEVLYTSGLGRWAHANAVRAAVTDPHGPLAQDLVVKAWLNLDKKEILALEEALPGSTQEHLPAVWAVKALQGVAGTPSLSAVRKALATPRGRWARETFRHAGAPVDDLKHGGAFDAWQRAHPDATAQTVLALHAQGEAAALNAAMNNGPAGAHRLVADRPVRRL